MNVGAPVTAERDRSLCSFSTGHCDCDAADTVNNFELETSFNLKILGQSFARIQTVNAMLVHAWLISSYAAFEIGRQDNESRKTALGTNGMRKNAPLKRSPLQSWLSNNAWIIYDVVISWPAFLGGPLQVGLS